MSLEEIFGLAGSVVARYLPMAMVRAPFGYLPWRRVRRCRAEIKRHRDAGMIGPVFLLQVERMPIHFELLAGVGAGGPVAQLLNERVMRPSVGVRLLMLAISGLMAAHFFRPGFAPEGFDEALNGLPVSLIVVRALVVGAISDGILSVFFYEARYDNTVLIISRMVVFRREFRWKHLQRIAGDGRHDLALVFAPRGKAKVLRHSTGVKEFKAFALMKLQENEAPNARTSRG